MLSKMNALGSHADPAQNCIYLFDSSTIHRFDPSSQKTDLLLRLPNSGFIEAVFCWGDSLFIFAMPPGNRENTIYVWDRKKRGTPTLFNKGLPDKYLVTLTRFHNEILLGTYGSGVFRLNRQQQIWEPVIPVLRSSSINIMLVVNQQLHIGTKNREWFILNDKLKTVQKETLLPAAAQLNWGFSDYFNLQKDSILLKIYQGPFFLLTTNGTGKYTLAEWITPGSIYSNTRLMGQIGDTAYYHRAFEGETFAVYRNEVRPIANFPDQSGMIHYLTLQQQYFYCSSKGIYQIQFP